MDYKTSDVSLDLIETNDHTFKITTNNNPADLALSISAIGLLQPPLLIKKGKCYIVVSGFRRIAAYEAMNIASIPARINDDKLPPLNYARFAIADNSSQRSLNVVEQSRAFALIRRFAGRSADWLKTATATGLPASQAAMDRLLPIADMPESMQNAIVDNRIALPIALQINQLKKEDAATLSHFFGQIGTGLNIQRELLEYICEISIRDEVSIVNLLAQNDVTAILTGEDTTAPQKVHQLRRLLKVKRYPEVSRAEAAFLQALKALRLNPCVQIQPPRFFEGNDFRLTMTIDSRRQLRSLMPEIENIAEKARFLPE